MKIHEPIPENVIRLMITKSGEKTEYLTLSDCTQTEAINWLKELFGNLSPFVVHKRTTIQVREAIGGANGKCRSIAFFGLNPDQVKHYIIEDLNINK